MAVQLFCHVVLLHGASIQIQQNQVVKIIHISVATVQVVHTMTHVWWDSPTKVDMERVLSVSIVSNAVPKSNANNQTNLLRLMMANMNGLHVNHVLENSIRNVEYT